MVNNLKSHEKFLDYFDFYGKYFNIHISGKEKHTTIFGSILGMISIIGIIMISLFLLQNLFENKNKNITFNQNRDVFPINNLTDSPFMFIFLNNYGLPLDIKGIIEVRVVFMNYKKIKNESGDYNLVLATENIPHKNCEINSTYGEYKEIFKDVPILRDYNCISPNSKNLTIYGKFLDPTAGFSYINFYLGKCDNKTSNYSCKSKQ